MKKISVLLVGLFVLVLVGCSAGATSQSDIEKNADDIQLDKSATPDPNATLDIKEPPPKTEYGKQPYGGG